MEPKRLKRTWSIWRPRDQKNKHLFHLFHFFDLHCHIAADERSALIYRVSHFCVKVVLLKYCTTFVAKLRCDGKNVATSRSPNAGWLAVHFWPTARKMESFQRVTGILGQTLQIFPIQQISTCKLASNKCWNQPILKTCQVPLKHSLAAAGLLAYISLHLWGDVHSPTAGAWLTCRTAQAAHFTHLPHFVFLFPVHFNTKTLH